MSTNLFLVRLRIVCIHPPQTETNGRPITFGLQDKKSALQPAQQRSDGTLVYECEAKASKSDSGMPNFTGSYTHGTPNERFLYISVRFVDQINWIRRSKIMLSGITWEMVEAASASDRPIEITIEGVVTPRAKVAQSWQVAGD